jgi:hypothetical protein
MKPFLLAGAATIALCAGAQAAVIDATVTYVPFTGAGSYFAPTTTSSTLTELGRSGSDGSSTSPFSDDTTPYDVVHANGTATFGPATGSGSFGTGSGSFTFLWGTPDTYNTLNFFSGSALVATATGTGDGSGSFVATVNGLPSFDSVQFQSGADAFEFAAVSAVPLPASLPMFGGAVLALGVVGYRLRRKGSAARA